MNPGTARPQPGTSVIYFEAQTGTIRTAPPAVTNFYQYRVLESHRREIERAVVAAEKEMAEHMAQHGATSGVGPFLDRLLLESLEEWEREVPR